MDRTVRSILIAVILFTFIATVPTPAAAADHSDYRVYVSNEYGANVTVIDGRSGQVVDTVKISGRPGDVRPRGMAVSPGGRRLYIAVSDFDPHTQTEQDKIVAVDTATNEIVAEYRVGSDPERVAVGPDGKTLWASNEDAAMATGFDIESGEVIAQFPAGVEPEGVAVSPDGHWVFVTGESSHTVTVFDTEKKRVVKYILVGNRPRFVVFAADGQEAYASAEIGGTISVIDVEHFRVTDTISLGLDARPVGMTLSPDGNTLFVAGGGTSAVYLVDTRQNRVVRTIKARMGRRPWGIAYAPDDKVYTADGNSDSVTVIDAKSRRVQNQIGGGRGPHTAVVAVLPD